MELPASLYCIHLAYNLDDKDVVEKLLTQYPEETERCIAIALRQMLNTNIFFSTQELVEYLSLLWRKSHINNKLVSAGTLGLTYLIPYLLDRKADIHADNDYSLRSAAYFGHAETIRLLLDRNADIHAYNDEALRLAANNGHAETIRLLLDRNADIHADDDEALRLAADTDRTGLPAKA